MLCKERELDIMKKQNTGLQPTPEKLKHHFLPQYSHCLVTQHTNWAD